MRTILLSALLLVAGALIGAIGCYQVLLWRVTVAEGIRDAYALAAMQVAKECTPKVSDWPRKRGP